MKHRIAGWAADVAQLSPEHAPRPGTYATTGERKHGAAGMRVGGLDEWRSWTR